MRAPPITNPESGAETIEHAPISPPRPPHRSVVLVGLMGAGKTSVGKHLAATFGIPFIDADKEIEAAAGCSIADFFDRFGEAEFRRGEERVIMRILNGPVCVLASGGGAFMSPEIRAAIREKAVSVWLSADFEVLFERVSRRSNRPLLQTDDPAQTLREIMEARYPTYGEADITVESDAGPIRNTVTRVHAAVTAWFKAGKAAAR